MRTDDAPRLVVRAVEARVRPAVLRLPFRFGAATLTACPQLFVRVEIDGGTTRTTGWAAELMVPKWFDKRASQSPQRNVEHLAASVTLAAQAYLNDVPATPYALHARHRDALARAGASAGLTELSAGYGQAVLDRAVLDALCRSQRVSFFDAAARNLFGLGDEAPIADLPDWDWPAWLATLRPMRRIEARHTVGLLDELDTVRDGDDGLPISLRAVIRRYGQRSFKIKLGGDPVADLARLRDVLAVLDAECGAAYRYTLDGNEQYADMDALRTLLRGLAGSRAPLYIEQPVPRELSFETALPTSPIPFLMDEADGTLDAFPRGRAIGWRGVSSKGCKGLYKALINRARCDHWNAANVSQGTAWFMSAEDLTCQAGLALQQDLALAALLGLTHSERNGHHYGRGLRDAPDDERDAFMHAHPDLYDRDARLRIADGVIALDSLHDPRTPGYAHGADPDAQAMQPLDAATTLL